MPRPLLLDAFCGAGGCSVGYHRAGFDVVGVDNRPQPRYPFDFVQADALEYLAGDLSDFDAIHASPPCQAYTRARVIRGREHPDLVAETRRLLQAARLPYVIENVVGAPLLDPVVLCSAAVGLPMCRHRLFETNWTLLVPPCQRGTIAVLPEHVHHTRRPDSVRGRRLVRGVVIFGANARAQSAKDAMEIDWMNRDEVSLAVPPAMTELIGHQLAQFVRAAA